MHGCVLNSVDFKHTDEHCTSDMRTFVERLSTSDVVFDAKPTGDKETVLKGIHHGVAEDVEVHTLYAEGHDQLVALYGRLGAMFAKKGLTRLMLGNVWIQHFNDDVTEASVRFYGQVLASSHDIIGEVAH
jgi:hypothetical protein